MGAAALRKLVTSQLPCHALNHTRTSVLALWVRQAICLPSGAGLLKLARLAAARLPARPPAHPPLARPPASLPASQPPTCPPTLASSLGPLSLPCSH